MTRLIPDELHIGQKILVHPNPTTHPLNAIVTYIDHLTGLVHVRFETMSGLWAVRPPAISSLRGLYLHFKNQQFYFSPEPFFMTR